MTALPDGWQSESIADVARGGLFTDGNWVESKDQDLSGGVRLTQLADVGVGTFRDRSNRWMREDQAARLGCTFIEPADVLVARMPDPIGRACLAPATLGRAVTAVDVAILRPARDDVDRRYLMWAINSPLVHERITRLQSGTTRKRVSRKNLATVKVPLPPLDEQRRIVEILEDHLSRLEAADRSLDSAMRRGEHLELAAIESLNSANTPFVRLEDVAVSSGYGTSTKCIVDGPGMPVARIPNIVGGTVDLTDEKRAADSTIDLSGLMLRPGDVLFVRTNGSKDLIGRTAVVQSDVKASFASYLIRYQFDTSRVLPGWVRLMMERPTARVAIERLAASSAGQYNLSLGKINQLEMPLPDTATQRSLIEQHNLAIEGPRRLIIEAAKAKRRSAALRRSLLAAAFSGRLTGSESDIEHAEETAGV